MKWRFTCSLRLRAILRELNPFNSSQSIPWARRCTHLTSRLARSLIWYILGFVLLTISILPTFKVPAYGDDFNQEVTVYGQFNGSLFELFLHSWQGNSAANRFVPIGHTWMYFSDFANYVVSTSTGIGMHWLLRFLGLLLFGLVILGAAFATQQALKFLDRKNKISLAGIFAGLSVIVATTLQLHPWSHDATLTIADAGLSSSALAFLILGLAFWSTNRTSTKYPALLIALFSITGVWFYEIVLTAIAGSAVIYLWNIYARRHQPENKRRAYAFFVAGTITPAIAYLLGLMYSSTLDLVEYSGTSVKLGPEGLLPLGILVLSAVPGTAWDYSAVYAKGIELSTTSVASGFVIAFLIIAVSILAIRSKRQPLNVRTSQLWAVATAFAVFFYGTLAMHSFTEKHIREAKNLGWVYISYVQTATIVAIALLIIFLLLNKNFQKTIVLTIVPLATAFAMVQSSVNWNVAIEASTRYANNKELLSASSQKIQDESRRCKILASSTKKMPDETRKSITSRINSTYEAKFGVPFCSVAEPNQAK